MINKKTTDNKITKDTKIIDILNKNPKNIDIMLKYGLVCATCPLASIETLGQAARAYGMDEDTLNKMLDELNKC